ncbi:hypothetical protein BJ912DRAFT_1064606 [Pholiota molesta]|nr:hypothetical protein BJ912DRAFT_1064606 [Pholiota molesta]
MQRLHKTMVEKEQAITLALTVYALLPYPQTPPGGYGFSGHPRVQERMCKQLACTRSLDLQQWRPSKGALLSSRTSRRWFPVAAAPRACRVPSTRKLFGSGSPASRLVSSLSMGTHVDGCAASACPFPCPWRVHPQGSGPVNDAPRTRAGAYCMLRHCSLRVPLSPLPPFAPAPPLPKHPPASAYCTLRRWILRARALATLATARSGGRWVRWLLHVPLRAPALATLATARSGGHWVRRLLRAPALATLATARSGRRWVRRLLRAPVLATPDNARCAGYAGYCEHRRWLLRTPVLANAR